MTFICRNRLAAFLARIYSAIHYLAKIHGITENRPYERKFDKSGALFHVAVLDLEK